MSPLWVFFSVCGHSFILNSVLNSKSAKHCHWFNQSMTTFHSKRPLSPWLLKRQKCPPGRPLKPKQGGVWFLRNIFWASRRLCLLAPCQAKCGGTRAVAVAAAQMTACQSSPRLHCVARELVGLQSICVYPNLNGSTTCKNKQRFPGRHIGLSCSPFVSAITGELIYFFIFGIAALRLLQISEDPWRLCCLKKPDEEEQPYSDLLAFTLDESFPVSQ